MEWILWRKWDNWSWTSMAIKVPKRFFNQNYTSFHSHYHRLLPPTKQALMSPKYVRVKFQYKNAFPKKIWSQLLHRCQETGATKNLLVTSSSKQILTNVPEFDIDTHLYPLEIPPKCGLCELLKHLRQSLGDKSSTILSTSLSSFSLPLTFAPTISYFLLTSKLFDHVTQLI